MFWEVIGILFRFVCTSFVEGLHVRASSFSLTAQPGPAVSFGTLPYSHFCHKILSLPDIIRLIVILNLGAAVLVVKTLSAI